jgi:hypothetical protein
MVRRAPKSPASTHCAMAFRRAAPYCPCEDVNEYHDLVAALAAEHAPEGPNEEHLQDSTSFAQCFNAALRRQQPRRGLLFRSRRQLKRHTMRRSRLRKSSGLIARNPEEPLLFQPKVIRAARSLSSLRSLRMRLMPSRICGCRCFWRAIVIDT